MIKNNEVVVSKKLIENIIEVLNFDTDRGFNCFEDEKNIINKLKQYINNMKKRRIELLVYSMTDFDKDELLIIDVEILKQLEELLMKRYNEYNSLIEHECIYSNKRILAEIKNRRDEFMNTEIRRIIERYNNKNKNFEELMNVINKNEEVTLEIQHSSICASDNNKIRIRIPTDIIEFNKNDLTIGSKLSSFELYAGIEFKFMLGDIETINKTFIFNGFELKFYSCPEISFLFDKEDKED